MVDLDHWFSLRLLIGAENHPIESWQMKTALDNKNIELIEGKNDNGNGCMMDKTMTNSPCSNQPYQNSNNNPP